jgi:hypothetical protein
LNAKEPLGFFDREATTRNFWVGYRCPLRLSKELGLLSDATQAYGARGLAQHFSYLHTMGSFNPTTVCPLVIDSPLQQEQDRHNIGAIFGFIFSRVLQGQQLILGTLHFDEVPSEIIPKDAKRIHLTSELHLLQGDQYADVYDRIGAMHEQTLAAD